MSVGRLTGNKRVREAAVPASGCESAAKKARLEAKKTCATFPDLNTVEGQDAFFNMVGVEGIELCFREDLKTVEQVYRQKVEEHATAVPISFANAKTRPIAPDGNCAFNSILVAAEDLGGSAAAGFPRTSTEMRQQMVAHVEREYAAWRDTPASNLPDEKQYLAVLPRDDHERGRMLDQLGTPGSWHHEMGDLYVAIAAATFNVRIEVITPYTDHEHRLVFGPADPDLPLLVLRRKGAHYEPVIRCSALPARPT
ncbi:OTU domain-containing protein [Rhizobacter sp. P5_C2]